MNPPKSQLSNGLKSGSLLNIRIPVIAVANAPMANPAKSSVDKWVLPDFMEIRYAIKTATIPPQNEATGRRLKYPYVKGIPERKTMVAPSDAPEATPIKYGSAKGFLNKPWYVAPEMPRDAPTSNARTTLGNLMFHIIVCQADVSSPDSLNKSNFENSIKNTEVMGICTDPTATPLTAQMSITTIPRAILSQGYLYANTRS